MEMSLELTLPEPLPRRKCARIIKYIIYYMFTARGGTFADCDVVRQVMTHVPARHAGEAAAASALQRVDRENINLDTMKPAEDGSEDIILRLYESKKLR